MESFQGSSARHNHQNGDYAAFIVVLANGPSRARAAAADQLGHLGEHHAVQPLIQALSDEDPIVRHKVAWALGRLADARALEPLITTAMTDKDTTTRVQAIGSLGSLADSKAIEPLARLLADPNQPLAVRREII